MSECAGVQMLRFAGTFQYIFPEVRSVCTHSFPLRKPEHPNYASSSSNNPSNPGLRPCSYVYGPVPRIPFPAHAAGYCFLLISLDRRKMSNACAGPGRSSPSEPPPEVPLEVPQGTPRYPEGASGRASRKPVKQHICRFCWLTRPRDFTLKYCQI